jgi:hypothetical protein
LSTLNSGNRQVRISGRTYKGGLNIAASREIGRGWAR